MPNSILTIRSRSTGPAIGVIDAPGGVAGNLATLRQMAAMVQADTKNEALRQFVHHRVIENVAPHNFSGEVDACFDWLKRNVKYRRDAWGTQRVADLATTIAPTFKGEKGTANCVSLSVALATMLALIGKKPAFVVLAQRPWTIFEGQAGWEFDHVYVCVEENGYCTPMDPTPNDARPGRAYGSGERRRFEIF